MKRFLVASLGLAVSFVAGEFLCLNAEPLPGGSLDPTLIPKYADPLVIPPAMPRTSRLPRNIDYYEIAVRQFHQQILPAPLPATKVWSYGSVNHPGTFNYPAFTIEARVNTPVRVKWINDLKDPVTGKFLPHLLTVDQTLHWANPPGGPGHTDTRTDNPLPYLGPVPIVTHVHGAHVGPESDGYPEAWFLPNATDLAAGFAAKGEFYDQFDRSNTEPGTAVFQYPNDQRATTLWYHDHTLGMTRLNVYAGPAGFYLLRGGAADLRSGVLPGPAPALGDAPGKKYYEIPIVVQDRSFNADGSLFYPRSREFFDGFAGPYIPNSDISPIWNPEFFGNTMVVNGKTWPYLNVESRRYRFRFLNGCNSRFVVLKMVANPLAARPATAALPFWQIGTEGGFLPAPVRLEKLLMGLAERADVIVDFSGLAVGTEIYLTNEGPDEPFGGGEPPGDFSAADPGTTGQVMKFVVVAPSSTPDTSTPPAALKLPKLTPLGPATSTRQVSLNEEGSAVLCADARSGRIVGCNSHNAEPFGPRAALLGTVDLTHGEPLGISRMWMDDITETPALGATEMWEIYNFTEDAHPIHLHQVQFQVVNREAESGRRRLPEAWETGFKDTVIAYPGEITRIKAKFDIPGLFVWHCHIVEHEDNEMMRPYFVGPPR
jgi:bilirubin oxidase